MGMCRRTAVRLGRPQQMCEMIKLGSRDWAPAGPTVRQAAFGGQSSRPSFELMWVGRMSMYRRTAARLGCSRRVCELIRTGLMMWASAGPTVRQAAFGGQSSGLGPERMWAGQVSRRNCGEGGCEGGTIGRRVQQGARLLATRAAAGVPAVAGLAQQRLGPGPMWWIGGLWPMGMTG